jgi:anti-sigma regulatory factor (Ser/Thr protein kinase)
MKWEVKQSDHKFFLQVKTGNKTQGQIVKELLQHFGPEAHLTKAGEKAFYPAVVECMDNVMKHAYAGSRRGGILLNQWWLMGYRDSETHEIFFCFFDQGLGIPKTIRTRLKDKFGPLSLSDSEIIEKAVIEGHYSSTKDPTRGRGLPTLKRFIDTAQLGQLMIVSHKSRCIFTRDGTKSAVLNRSFGGTLVAWKLQKKA